MISRLLASVFRQISRPKSLLLYFVALIFGYVITLAFSRLMPKPLAYTPDGAIAASFLIHFAGLGLLLAKLPATSESSDLTRAPAGATTPWNAGELFGAWLQCALATGAAYCGLILSRTGETYVTFLALWSLYAAHSSVLAAGFGLLCALFNSSRHLPRQIALVLLCAAATALFWSREPIQAAGQAAPQSNASAVLAEGTLKLSPMGAVASTWYQEGDGARAQTNRFDLMHGVLTYDQWIGRTGLTIAYPRIFPGHDGDGEQRAFRSGIVLAMLLWALPLMALCDLLRLRSRN